MLTNRSERQGLRGNVWVCVRKRKLDEDACLIGALMNKLTNSYPMIVTPAAGALTVQTLLFLAWEKIGVTPDRTLKKIYFFMLC